jgi:hypothetical protein
MALLTPITALISGPSQVAAAASVAFPVKISDNHRYLVDQNGQPFLLVGDSPQALVGDISEADAEYYFANRQAAGFNAQWINLLCNGYTGCRSDGSTYDGIAPFTTPGDLATPNEAYFSKVDRILKLAGNHGQLVLLDPIETGGWLSVASSNGSKKAYDYGKFLGQRYKNVPNIVWMSGNDFQSWNNSSDDAVIRAVAQGIKDNDPAHLQTVELNYQRSGSLDDPTWTPLLGLDAAYTYFPTYDQVLAEYNRASVPVFMVEANYDGEHNAGDPGSPQILRRQEYWTFLSGATGQLYGNRTTWQFADGWKSNLDIRSSAQFHFAANLLTSRQWYDLVPDQNHHVVTAGYGTYSREGSLGSNDYLTAARTPDGTLAIAYMPTLRPITVDLSSLSASVNATWYDPASGTYVSIDGGPFANSGTHEFVPPGPNADGDGDWVLVLETRQPPAASAPAASAPSPTAVPPTALPASPQPTAAAPETAVTQPPSTAASAKFVQTSSAVPQTPEASVSLDYPQPQSAGNTSIVVVGWNDSTSDVASVTDTAGNSYQVAAPTARGDGVSQAIYYARNIAGGPAKVNVTFSTAVPFADVRIAEYAGLDTASPLDASASAAGSAGNASSGAVTTGTANTLVIGAGITTGAFSGPGAQFTLRVITSPDGDILEDSIAGNAGLSVAATASGGGNWVMQVATFH